MRVAVGAGVSVGGSGVAVRVGGSGDGVSVGIGVSVGGIKVGVSVGNGEGVSVGLCVGAAVGVTVGDGEATLPTVWVGAGKIGAGVGRGVGWQPTVRSRVSARPRTRWSQARLCISITAPFSAPAQPGPFRSRAPAAGYPCMWSNRCANALAVPMGYRWMRLSIGSALAMS